MAKHGIFAILTSESSAIDHREVDPKVAEESSKKQGKLQLQDQFRKAR
jgi:hypothetical protein